MSLNLPDYKGRDVRLAAFIKGSDEVGGKYDRRSSRLRVPDT
jgi:hypothetical protein